MTQPYPIDLKRLFGFFQNLYAHSLALDEIQAEVKGLDPTVYPRLKAHFDKEAADKFAMFYRALDNPKDFEEAATEFLDIESRKKPN
jgi:hypothetical protein